MPRFYINSFDIINNEGFQTVLIKLDDAVHITKVLRMKIGDRLTLCDENGYEYDSEIISLGDTVNLRISERKPSENESPVHIVVFQALVKGDRFDTVIQKSTEMGADSIVPVITSRCVVRLDEKDYPKKVIRWQRIAYEASKQCGRGSVPNVEYPIVFKDAVDKASSADLPLFCFEGDGTKSIKLLIESAEKPETVSVFIGPEGGFSDDEASYASTSGMLMTGLGKRILRTETAAPFTLACLSYKYEL